VAPIGHEGRWLTDAAGRVILAHGVNVVQKSAPYTPASAGFSDADAAWLSANGFQVVRVGLLATGLMPTAGVVDEGYVQAIAATVQTLAKHSIFSLLDFHQDGWGPSVGSDGFPAWMTLTGSAMNTHAGFPYYYVDNPAVQQAFQSFWDDATGPDGKGLEESYVAMVTAVATAFASEPYVIGYDLFNEPWPGTTYTDCLVNPAGCPSLDASELGPLYAKAVSAIRGAGDQHLIFGEPWVLFNSGTTQTSIPLPGGDSNAGMSFHIYPQSTGFTGSAIQNALSWSSSTGGALLNTEWGATTDGGVLTSESVALDSAFVPWIFWSFASEVITSFDAAPGPSNLVPSTVSALVEPYPLAVAGEPLELTLDPSSHTLSFTWSTTPVGSGKLAAGAVTTIEAPSSTYPGGYTATVTGGSIRSAPCAPLLTVAATSGASSVSVTVTPGGTCP
jgi:endoglycosylceramidase